MSSSVPVILAQESDWIAINKPAGWLCHSAGTDTNDLVSWLQLEGLGPFAPVHRLDLGTSGVAVLARQAAVSDLAESFAMREVEKHYTALVFGVTRQKGTLRRALPDARRGKPVPAETRYRRLEEFGKWSLLDVRPVTGRKHQIRRHLQGIGHALIGDDRFGPRGKKTVPAFPGRLWLHCASLEVPDLPRLEAPLPEELERHLEVLRLKVAKPASVPPQP